MSIQRHGPTAIASRRVVGRRLVRQFAGVVFHAKDDAAKKSAVEQLLDNLAPLLDEKASAAQLKQAEQRAR